MAFVSINLPATAGDGPGAWVDASALGATRTITVEGNGGVFSPFVTIECSNQSSPTVGYPLAVFQLATETTFEVACMWMRAVVSNYVGGGAPTVNVGGDDSSGTTSLQLPVPVGNGRGAAIDVTALPTFKTVQVGGRFGGTLLVLISEDGGTTYTQAFSFQTGSGFQTIVIAADHMLVARVGVPLVDPGMPVVWVAATAAGGGGGAGGVIVQENGVDVVNPATTLNFSTDFDVTDAGSGVADIALAAGVRGVDVQENGVDVVNPATTLNFSTDFDVTDAGGGVADIALTAGINGNRVSFLYTATGSEGDSFVVGFPGAIERADLNYNVQITMGNYTFMLVVAAPNSGFQLGAIQIDTNAVVSAGDQFMIDIVNRT